MAILGMCMLIGDGILTPAISGLLFVDDISILILVVII
jgi:K+ transporter